MIRYLISAFMLLASATAAGAHPAPFSYLDLRLDERALTGSLTVHAIDVAHALGIESPEAVLDEEFASSQRNRIFALIADRFEVRLDGVSREASLRGVRALPERQALRLDFAFAPPGDPATVEVSGHLFPYDSNHQTFVNIYEAGHLVHQAILNVDRTTAEHFTGTRQGVMAVIGRFVASGIQHIVIGRITFCFWSGYSCLAAASGRCSRSSQRSRSHTA